MKIDASDLKNLHRYGYSLTGDKDSAYDLLHNAIEVCLKKPPLEKTKVLSYVRSIMRNRYIDEFRHEQRFPTDNIDDHSLIDMDGSSLENIIIAEHDMGLIWTQLDGFDREILFYWAVEGYSMQEIANHIDVPRGTLLSRIHRLRQKIITTMDTGTGVGGHGI